jgi:hypothetical protein
LSQHGIQVYPGLARKRCLHTASTMVPSVWVNIIPLSTLTFQITTYLDALSNLVVKYQTKSPSQGHGCHHSKEHPSDVAESLYKLTQDFNIACLPSLLTTQHFKVTLVGVEVVCSEQNTNVILESEPPPQPTSPIPRRLTPLKSVPAAQAIFAADVHLYPLNFLLGHYYSSSSWPLDRHLELLSATWIKVQSRKATCPL